MVRSHELIAETSLKNFRSTIIFITSVERKKMLLLSVPEAPSTTKQRPDYVFQSVSKSQVINSMRLYNACIFEQLFLHWLPMCDLSLQSLVSQYMSWRLLTFHTYWNSYWFSMQMSFSFQPNPVVGKLATILSQSRPTLWVDNVI